MKKRVLSLLLAMTMVLQMCSGMAVAFETAEPELEGSCGENVSFRFSPDSGELSIWGNGDMYDYGDSVLSPWGDMADDITAVYFGMGVTSIGDSVFYGCRKLSTVSISSTVTSIGYGAFTDCTSLTEISLPEKLTYLGTAAFEGCTGLKKVTVPGGITAIRDYTFAGCSSLEEITMPAALESVGWFAFNDCSALQCLTFPDTLTAISDNALQNCSGLTDLCFHGDWPYSSYTVSCIGCDPAAIYTGCSGASYIREEYQWNGNAGTTDPVVLMENAAWRLSSAAMSRSDARSLAGEMGGRVAMLDSYSKQIAAVCVMSYSAHAGSDVWLGASYSPWMYQWYWDEGDNLAFTYNNLDEGTSMYDEEMGLVLSGYNFKWYGASEYYSRLALLELPIRFTPVPEVEEESDKCGDAVMWALDESTGVLTISGEGTMYDYGTGPEEGVPWWTKKNLVTSVVVEEGVTYIGSNAFTFHMSLSGISLPSTLAGIGAGAFYQDTGLRKVDLCETAVTDIGQDAFGGCEGMTELRFPATLKSVGPAAFDGCTGLTALDFPSALTELDSSALSTCYNLSRISFYGANPFDGPLTWMDYVPEIWCPAGDESWLGFEWSSVSGQGAQLQTMAVYRDHSYWVESTPLMSYRDAVLRAAELGGYPVTITDSSEDDYVSRLAEPYYNTTVWYWLGAAGNDGVWTWDTGETWSYSNWQDTSVGIELFSMGGAVAAEERAVLNLTEGQWKAVPAETAAGGIYEVAPFEPAVTVEVPEEPSALYIYNLDDLKTFRDTVNSGGAYAGETVYLAADIDLLGAEWMPIGTSDHQFQGTFDGQGHTIRNLVITGYNSYVGLFGYTAEGAVRDLTVENASVSGRLNVGAVAGYSGTSEYSGIILTGHVEINGMSYVGGVLGKGIAADVTDITVNADSTSYVRGYSVENGEAYRTYAGGVIGHMMECDSLIIRNVVSNIDVIGSTSDVGGIAGIANYSAQFINCSSSGDVMLENAADLRDALEIGGIAGVWHNADGMTVTIRDCAYTGSLSSTYVDENGDEISLSDDEFLNGGLVGSAYYIDGTGELIIDREAYIRTTAYATLAAALAAAKAGDRVQLMKNVSSDAILTIDKAVTLDGNGYTLTSTAPRAININTTGPVTVTDLIISGGTGCERGINIFYQPAVVELERVSISGVSHYAVNVTANAGAAELTIRNCELTGWAALSLHGPGSEISVIDSTLTGANTPETMETYHAIDVGGDDMTVSVTGGSVTAVSAGVGQALVGGAAENAVITLDTELIRSGVDARWFYLDPTKVSRLSVREVYAEALFEDNYVARASETEGLVDVVARDANAAIFVVDPETGIIIGINGSHGSLTIPKTVGGIAVTGMTGGLLRDQSALTAIGVEEGHTVFSAVDGVLYNADGTTLLACPPAWDGEVYTIPESLAETMVSVGDYAFAGSTALRGIYLPNSVTGFAENALRDIDALPTVYGGAGSAAQTAAGAWDLPYVAAGFDSISPVSQSNIGGDSWKVTLIKTDSGRFPLTFTCVDGAGNSFDVLTEYTTGMSGNRTTHTLTVDLRSLGTGTYTFTASNPGYGASISAVYAVDRTPPSVPADIDVAAGELEVTISWAAVPEANAREYIVYRSTDENAVGEVWAELAGSGDHLSFRDVAVEAGVTYYYRVSAVDVYGQESELSQVVSAVPLPDTTAPQLLSISPANASTLSGEVTVTLQLSDHVAMDRVSLQVSSDGESWENVGEVTTSGTARFTLATRQWSDGKLHLHIRAWDRAGNCFSDQTTYFYLLDNTAPARVAGLKATVTATTVTLNWDDVPDQDLSHFVVDELDGEGNVLVSRPVYQARGIHLTGLTPGVSYHYRVQAVDRQGNQGEWSETITVTTAADTTHPVIAAISPAPGDYTGTIQMTFTVSDDQGVDWLRVQYSEDQQQWTDLDTVPVGLAGTSVRVNYALDSSRLPEGLISVRAVAADLSGNESDSGATAPFTQYRIDRTAPAAPQSLTATAGDGCVVLTWQQGAEEDLHTYSVYRSAAPDSGFALLCSGLKQLGWTDRGLSSETTYYYHIVVSDKAGNVSAPSDTVSCKPLKDSVPPQVVSVSPSENYVLGTATDIRVKVYDNSQVAVLYYQLSEDGGSEWTEPVSVAVGSSDRIVSLSGVAQAVSAESFVIRIWCEDAVGLTSSTLTRTYGLDRTPPAAPAVAAVPADLAITVTWTGSHEADLAGYTVYRSEDGGSYRQIGTRSAGENNYTFRDTGVAVGCSYSYYVTAQDTRGNTAESGRTAYVSPLDNDIIAPKAVITCPATGTTGREVAFSAARSSDNVGIVSYLWDFGGGSTSTLREPYHIFNAAGTYAVVLTVTDAAGNSHTASVSVRIRDPQQMGTLQVTVTDESGYAVSHAGVYLDLGSSEQSLLYTDAYGRLSVQLTAGTHEIGVYTEGYLPAKESVTILAGETEPVTFVTPQENIVVGELTVTRMTLEEIVAAGIDVADPANQEVYTFTVRLTYGTYEAVISTICNGIGETLTDPEPVDIIDANGESRIIDVGVIPMPGPVGGGGTGDDDDTPSGGGGGAYFPEKPPMIVILDIPGEASWLKDFFDVRLTVINQADTEFYLDDCVAVLNVPAGLTLMETNNTSAQAVFNMGTIQGQSSASANWILRGDEPGQYDLSADFTATLREFGAPVKATFRTKEPFTVRQGDGLSLDVVVENAILANTDGAVRIGLRNDNEFPYYYPRIALNADLVELSDSFKTNGRVPVDTDMDVLNSGETLWYDYIIPRSSWEDLMTLEGTDLHLMDAIVVAEGDFELPYTVQEVMPFTIAADKVTVSLVSGGATSPLNYISLGKTNPVKAEIPKLRITTYRLDENGAYEPCSMQVLIQDEYRMKKDKNEGITVTTNSKGYYDLDGYSFLLANNDKSYTIRISSRRAQPVEIPVVIRGASAESGIVRVYAYTTVDGVDSVLTGATVTISSEPGETKSEKTGKTGGVEFGSVKQGYQEITVSMPGYLPVTDLVEVKEDNEFCYRLTPDPDPNASTITMVRNSFSDYTSGNQTIIPEGRVTGTINFTLSHRLAEDEKFAHYLYRIVRDSSVEEEGEFTGPTSFSLNLAELKAGDRIQFALATYQGDELCCSTWVDSNIRVTEAPGFFSDLMFSLTQLQMKSKGSFGENLYFDPSVFAKFVLSGIFKKAPTANDKKDEQKALLDILNGFIFSDNEGVMCPVSVQYETSGKLIFSVRIGTAGEGDSTLVSKGNGVNVMQFGDGLSRVDAGFALTLDFVWQYDPVKNEWNQTVYGGVEGEQEIPLFYGSYYEILYASLSMELEEEVKWSVFRGGVGPMNVNEWFGSVLPYKASVEAAIKGAAGAKLILEKLAHAELFLKGGFKFDFMPQQKFSVSAAFGVEYGFLLWEGESEIASDTWEVFSNDSSRPLSLMETVAAINSLKVLRAGADTGEWTGGDGVLLSGVFSDAGTQTVTLPDGSVLMVWCDYTGSAADPVALHWSVFDNGMWSEPQLVDSDGTADLYPHLIPTAAGAELVWVDFDDSVADMQGLTAEQIREQAFAMLDVSCASFADGSWTESVTLSGNDRIAAKPRVAMDGSGGTMVAWLSNEANLTTGTAEAPDHICWTLLRDGEVEAGGTVAVPAAVHDLVLGWDGGYRMSVLSDAEDGSIRVHQAAFGGEDWSALAPITAIAGSDSAMTQSPDGAVYFINSDRLYRFSGGSLTHLLRSDLIGEDAGELTCASTEEGTVLLWTTIFEGRNALCMTLVSADGTACRPILMDTAPGDTVSQPAAADAGGELLVVTRQGVMGEESWEQLLVSKQIALLPDLAVTADSVRHSGYLLPGAALDTFVTAENLGIAAPGGFRAEIFRVTENGEELLASESGSDDLNLTIRGWTVPEDYNGETLYLRILPEGGTDPDRSNNTAALTNVVRELSVSEAIYVGRQEEGDVFTVRVENCGLTAVADAVLTVEGCRSEDVPARMSAADPVLLEYAVPALAPGQSVVLRLTLPVLLDRTVEQPLAFVLSQPSGETAADNRCFVILPALTDEAADAGLLVHTGSWLDGAGNAVEILPAGSVTAVFEVENLSASAEDAPVLILAAYDSSGKMLQSRAVSVTMTGGARRIIEQTLLLSEDTVCVKAFLLHADCTPLRLMQLLPAQPEQ